MVNRRSLLKRSSENRVLTRNYSDMAIVNWKQPARVHLGSSAIHPAGYTSGHLKNIATTHRDIWTGPVLVMGQDK
ncbi:uncharacterized protein STEHIDRAFT_118225 [Stereum hirsutum FP-91666 SS1]|uniref:uncharacterized protein n=1 Tax=Stereum hirsutum (strain FP-91666) TaxID=721885 RepID=UPI000440C9F5|nr:uncharacterized protein STEHIDRAFT_118225 [Stereum hirsutum FP-91666 SS1]EIM91047.1 hypothetical protein STEHIDRAFT_118225 [Stereum hirsutum FP-91666 SS1]